MDMQLLLAAVPAGAGVAGVIVSIFRLKQGLAAERSFLNLLASNPAAERLRALREQMVRDGTATTAQLRQLTSRLERLSRALPEEQQRLIADGLLQRSARGRARYAEKLLDKAGIGSGSQPIAVQ